MIRLIRLFVLTCVAMTLAACAAFNPGPRTYTLSESQLLAVIAQKFPFYERVAELLDVQALAPRIKLNPASNRIETDVDLSLSERLLRSSFQGKLGMDYGLRFEPSDNSIRMTDVRVRSLVFSGVPQRYQSAVDRLGPFLAERMLSDFAVYRISPDDLRVVSGWRYAPSGFKITPEGLSVTLTPEQTP